MIEEALPSLRRFTFLALLSAVLLIGGMLLARWLTTPGHTPGQIIITPQNIAQPVITDQENAVTQPGYRASLYDTVWPTDMANLNRSNSVIDAGLPRDVTAETVAIDSVAMPYPVFAYTRDVDEVFVIGGTSFVLDRYVNEIDGMGELGLLQGQSAPHITKYNPFTGEQTRLALDRGAGSAYLTLGNERTQTNCYAEDRDNYIDIILVGDEEAARNVTFPSTTPVDPI